MPQERSHDRHPIAGELLAVADAAGVRLRADAYGNDDAGAEAAEALRGAATAAMAAGYSLSEIAHAEASGKAGVRDELRADALKGVKLTGRHVRQAEIEHHGAIVRAMRLGLSTREIAMAADVTHGTVRAIANRWHSDQPSQDVAAEQPNESNE